MGSIMGRNFILLAARFATRRLAEFLQPPGQLCEPAFQVRNLAVLARDHVVEPRVQFILKGGLVFQLNEAALNVR